MNQHVQWIKLPTSMLVFTFLLITQVQGQTADGLLPSSSETIRLDTTANSPTWKRSHIIEQAQHEIKTFVVQVSIDPTENPAGDHQAIAGISINLGNAVDEALHIPGQQGISFELREGKNAGFWDIWIDGVNESRREPNPKPAGWVDNRQFQKPWEFIPRAGGYQLRMIGTPAQDGTHLRFYFEHMDRPVFEHFVRRQVTPVQIGFYAVTGGQQNGTNIATFSDLAVQPITDLETLVSPSARDVVLDALDLNHPGLQKVVTALEEGHRERAGQLLLSHFRNRTSPIGPGYKLRYHGNNYLEVANAVLENRYGTMGPFAHLDTTFVDGAKVRRSFVEEDGTIRWDLCNGHLTRHFHWVSLAKAYGETKDKRYAKRFSREVQDWVAREPFFHPQNPDIGGLNMMDGTTFRLGYMNTSNIGRRCEMTWWPAYDEFRKTPEFTDEAHYHMLLGFLRQSRLIMNPSSFAVHDDGGAHISVALLQNALMLPEFAESKRWESEALRRWEEVLDVQFYEDGSHVSLSTGYNWASLMALENMIALHRRVDREIPSRFLKTLEKAYDHPVALSRPDQGQIDMNDGGWGMIDDLMQQSLKLFPERQDYLWMATKGQQGHPPDYHSRYFPNAGHVVMRTGWGPNEKYLFMDAGPVGASHGKEDKLNIYLDYGGHQLIASGGRGSYSGGPYAAYTGSTRGYNTILVDGGVQARIPYRAETYDEGTARRFIVNDRFEYAEGFHTHGWYAPGKQIAGKQTRQIVFVKGDRAPESSYWVIFDTVEPNDNAEHQYEAPFHIRRNHAQLVDESSWIVHAWDAEASLRIMPAVTEGLSVEMVHGQTEPHIQGWHVVGDAHAPMWTPIFRWNAQGTTTRAWVLAPAGPDQNWCVDRVELKRNVTGSLVLRCIRPDGRSDLIYRCDPNIALPTIDGIQLKGDAGVISIDETGKPVNQFIVTQSGE